MMKKTVSLLLVLTLALGLTVPSFAAGQTYDDVPESYWGYKDIEAVAEAGYMNGIGERQFAPEMKVSVAQFLTLLGRLVFPEIEVKEGETWYGPYVTKAQETGLLDGSQVNTADVFDEISRYDMAVVLRAAAKKLGITEKQAQASEITDYGMVPTMYAEAVLTVYGMGLIKGDNAGRFNGSNTMRRAEIATVIMRLDRATAGGTTPPSPTPTESAPVESVAPTIPPDEELVTYTLKTRTVKIDHAIGRPRDDKTTYLSDVLVKVYYTPDAGKTSILLAECMSPTVDESDSISALDSSRFEISFEAPESWSNYENYKAGNGFYFSAETMRDGQKLVTSDLRTDGRAHPTIFELSPGYVSWTNNPKVEFTPPDGEKAKFTFKGYVDGSNFAMDAPDHRLPNFTVQLHLADGTIVGETVSGADGCFSMECEVDALDGGFDIEQKLYYVTSSGVYKGVEYEMKGHYPSGEPILETLERLDVVGFDGIPRNNPNYNVHIVEEYAKKQ